MLASLFASLLIVFASLLIVFASLLIVFASLLICKLYLLRTQQLRARNITTSTGTPCVPVGRGCTHWPSLACGSPLCTWRLTPYHSSVTSADSKRYRRGYFGTFPGFNSIISIQYVISTTDPTHSCIHQWPCFLNLRSRSSRSNCSSSICCSR